MMIIICLYKYKWYVYLMLSMTNFIVYDIKVKDVHYTIDPDKEFLT